MDEDDNQRNWGYYEPLGPLLKGHNHLGLHLMPSMADRDTKPFLPGRDNNPVMVSANGTFQPRDHITDPPVNHIDYIRDAWINHGSKFIHMFPGSNPYNPVLPEPSGSNHPVLMAAHQPETPKEPTNIEETPIVKEEGGGPAKKRAGPKTPKSPKAKRARKSPVPKENGNSPSVHRAKTAKKNVEVVINGVDMDISGIPIPVCSCTGGAQQCYRWGCGGWQSACCTTTISMYPLPMSTKRRGARIAGRKMSQGAFKKVLERLASEGYDFANPIDLRTYWAKHGTNKFVIIR